jgi:cytochrome c biogenesis protein CcdA
VIGLLDGFNPCAFWVLMFLLSLLSVAKSRKRMLLIGTVFVVSSGIIYFGFMSAWFNFFTLIGVHRYITVILALVAIIMGGINLKEVFFFKKGISLMISDKHKPGLYQRVRKIIHTQSTLLAVTLTVVLAVFVNLIELTCTMGLPALFTKILTERQITVGAKYFYLVVYNVAYIVPLLLIVVAFSLTLGKYKMTEKSAKIFKMISGILMIGLGVWMFFYS